MNSSDVKNKLIEFIGSLPMPVILFDTNFEFLIQSEVLDKIFYSYFMTDFNQRYKAVTDQNALLEKFLIQENHETYMLKIDNTVLAVDMYLRSTMIADHEFKYIYVQIQDVSQAIQNQAVQEQILLSQINNDKMNGLAEISAGIAHEINNPLTVIVAKVQHIKGLIENFDPQSKDKILQGLDKIYHHSDRITKIIKSLKNFSRQTVLDDVELNSVSGMIEDSTNLLSEQIKNKGIQIQLNVSSVNLHVRCISTEITQIIVNLIKNSIDALAQIRQPVIRIDIDKIENNRVRMCFIDNGSGIPVTDRENIFKSFYTTKSAGKGTGLGLSLSRHLAQKNNGALYLNLEKAETCFCLELSCK